MYFSIWNSEVFSRLSIKKYFKYKGRLVNDVHYLVDIKTVLLIFKESSIGFSRQNLVYRIKVQAGMFINFDKDFSIAPLLSYSVLLIPASLFGFALLFGALEYFYFIDCLHFFFRWIYIYIFFYFNKRKFIKSLAPLC